MPIGQSASSYDPVVSWKTAIGYVRAVLDFTSTRAPRLPDASLARLPADAAIGATPPVEHLAVPGGQLAYRRYPAPTSRRALILIHGSAGFGDQFQIMASLIAKWDIAQVCTLDMRGHGLSDGAPGHAATAPDQMVGEIAHFLARLRAEGTADKVILGGHSAGGGLVLAVARTAPPDLVDAYLFLAPFLGLGSPVSRRHFGGWVKVRVARLLAVATANLLGTRRFNQATVLEFDPRAVARDARYVPSWSFNTVLAFGPGRWIEDAPPIPDTKPVLLVVGEGDECFHHDRYPAAFESIAPHAAIPEVGALGHWDILVDLKSISAVGAWLKTQPAAARPSESLALPGLSASRAS